jgi:hypothetical protein
MSASYVYPERKPNHNEPETPVKESEHAFDALRYAHFMNAQAGTGLIPPPTTGLMKPFYPGIGV